MMSNWKYVILLIVILSSCKTQTYVADIDTSYNRMNKYVKEDTAVNSLIEQYKVLVDAEMNTVVGVSDREIGKGKPESPLGSWFCNILYDEARKIYGADVDFAIQNYGGLRIGSIAKGDITVGKIYELMPFDNELIVIGLSGEEIYKLAQAMLDKGGWPMSANIKIQHSEGAVCKVMIGSQEVEAEATYHVALPDYVANGGDNMQFLRKHTRIDRDTFVRDVVINHLRNRSEEKIRIDESKRYIQVDQKDCRE